VLKPEGKHALGVLRAREKNEPFLHHTLGKSVNFFHRACVTLEIANISFKNKTLKTDPKMRSSCNIQQNREKQYH
jgi:hypothetical protein